MYASIDVGAWRRRAAKEAAGAGEGAGEGQTEHIRAMEAVLRPGEILLVPKHWWHFVECLDTPTISVHQWCDDEEDDAVDRLEESVVRLLVGALQDQQDAARGKQCAADAATAVQSDASSSSPSVASERAVAATVAVEAEAASAGQAAVKRQKVSHAASAGTGRLRPWNNPNESNWGPRANARALVTALGDIGAVDGKSMEGAQRDDELEDEWVFRLVAQAITSPDIVSAMSASIAKAAAVGRHPYLERRETPGMVLPQ